MNAWGKMFRCLIGLRVNDEAMVERRFIRLYNVTKHKLDRYINFMTLLQNWLNLTFTFIHNLPLRILCDLDISRWFQLIAAYDVHFGKSCCWGAQFIWSVNEFSSLGFKKSALYFWNDHWIRRLWSHFYKWIHLYRHIIIFRSIAYKLQPGRVLEKRFGDRKQSNGLISRYLDGIGLYHSFYGRHLCNSISCVSTPLPLGLWRHTAIAAYTKSIHLLRIGFYNEIVSLFGCRSKIFLVLYLPLSRSLSLFTINDCLPQTIKPWGSFWD